MHDEPERRARLMSAVAEVVAAPPEAMPDRLAEVEVVAGENLLAEAYSFLQRVVGIIALLLPPVVALGDYLIDDQPLRGSISSYYYGRTGGWFVGSLCALAVFFLSYDYRPRPGHGADKWLSNIASVAALGVALFPTSSEGSDAEGGSLVVSWVHLASAAVLFGCLAIFTLYHFTKTEPPNGRPLPPLRVRVLRIFRDPPDAALTPAKRTRNRIYRACGWIIVASMIAIGVNNALDGDLVYWFEAIAVWAFGLSWLVKSGAVPMLNDPEPEQRDEEILRATGAGG